MREQELEKFRGWLVERGAELLEPTNRYEVLRFRTGRGTSVLYQRESGALTPTGEIATALAAWRNGGSWRAAKPTKRRPMSPVVRTLRERDGAECFYCGWDLPEGEETVEHMVPVAHGGGHHISNLALACEECNQRAGHLSVVEKVRMREDGR